MQPESKQTVYRSQLHQRMFPDDLVLGAFGKLNPSTGERSAYFFELWMDSRPNRYMIKEIIQSQRKLIVADITKFLNKLGLRQMWDYQIKGSEIRFSNATDLALFKLGWDHDR